MITDHPANEAGWGSLVQLILRRIDTSPKGENIAALSEAIANAVLKRWKLTERKPPTIIIAEEDECPSFCPKPVSESI
jgi:hypothetical protein